MESIASIQWWILHLWAWHGSNTELYRNYKQLEQCSIWELLKSISWIELFKSIQQEKYSNYHTHASNEIHSFCEYNNSKETLEKSTSMKEVLLAHHVWLFWPISRTFIYTCHYFCLTMNNEFWICCLFKSQTLIVTDV